MTSAMLKPLGLLSIGLRSLMRPVLLYTPKWQECLRLSASVAVVAYSSLIASALTGWTT